MVTAVSVVVGEGHEGGAIRSSEDEIELWAKGRWKNSKKRGFWNTEF